MKKYKYHVIIVLLVVFNFCVVVKNRDQYLIKEYAVSTNNQENKIEFAQNQHYKIKAYYPDTDYSSLDNEIEEKIGNYIFTFKKSVDNEIQQSNQYYTLNIFYDTYSYENYLSYVFYIEEYTGGAHPNHDIWTVTYDIKEKRFVELDDLITTNSNFLDIVSSVSRGELILNPGIVDTQMLMDGTMPNKDNFSHFAFSENGLLFFFSEYQVAPYSSGSFVVLVPYSKIF